MLQSKDIFKLAYARDIVRMNVGYLRGYILVTPYHITYLPVKVPSKSGLADTNRKTGKTCKNSFFLLFHYL